MLIGSDPDTGNPALHIGQAEEVGKRVKNHIDKEFWSHVHVFVSKDENLTKSHVRYLEGKRIEKAVLGRLSWSTRHPAERACRRLMRRRWRFF